MGRWRVRQIIYLIQLIFCARNIVLSNRVMSKFEKINIVFGIIGLLADLVAILTFAAGIFSFKDLASNPPVNGFQFSHATFLVLSGFLLIYGWIVLSWWLSVSSVLKTLDVKRKTAKKLPEQYAFKSVTSVGIILSPIVLGWLYLLFKFIFSDGFPAETAIMFGILAIPGFFFVVMIVGGIISLISTAIQHLLELRFSDIKFVEK